jgi:hypothetical protein
MKLRRHVVSAFVLMSVGLARQTDLPLVYINEELGFTIRYPSNVRPITRDPRELDSGEMGYALALRFVTGDTQPSTILSVVARHPKPPMYPPVDLQTVRASCLGYRETMVGGRRAAVCVTCGRGACHWAVELPGAPQFTITGPNPSIEPEPRDRDIHVKWLLQQPEDTAYPVKSMIDSMRFRERQQRDRPEHRRRLVSLLGPYFLYPLSVEVG